MCRFFLAIFPKQNKYSFSKTYVLILRCNISHLCLIGSPSRFNAGHWLLNTNHFSRGRARGKQRVDFSTSISGGHFLSVLRCWREFLSAAFCVCHLVVGRFVGPRNLDLPVVLPVACTTTLSYIHGTGENGPKRWRYWGPDSVQDSQEN